MYTMKHTLKEIYENPFMKKHMNVIGADAFLYFVPAKKRELTLEELEKSVRMPWGGPFNGQTVIHMANFLEKIRKGQGVHFRPLWEEGVQEKESGDEEQEVYMPSSDSGEASAALMIYDVEGDEVRKPILICPGGAYMFVSLTDEGDLTAETLLKKGYRPFVLKYRCTPANPHPVPQLELTLAIKYLRANAEKYRIDANDLTIIGYSAGGHLCASQSAYAEEYDALLEKMLAEKNPSLHELVKGVSPKADHVCLSYAAIYLQDERDKEFRDTITGKKGELIDKLSIDLHVTKDYPQTYVWCCEDDRTVPYAHSVRIADALKTSQVSHKLHIYPSGDHGINIGTGTSAEGWIDEMLSFFYNQG